MRNKIYAKNTEYITLSQNLSKNLHFRKTFVYLGVVGNATKVMSKNTFRIIKNFYLFLQKTK